MMHKHLVAVLLFAAVPAFAQAPPDSQGRPRVNVEASGTADLSATNPFPARLTDGSSFIVPALDTSVDGIEALLTTIDADTGILAGAVAGTEFQTDVLVFPDNEPFNVAQYGGSAVGAGNAFHVQPGTGATWPGTEYTVNATAPADPIGATFLMERDDVITVLTEIEGDWTNPRSSAEGALWVQDFNSDDIRSELNTIEGWQQQIGGASHLEDTVHSTGHRGMFVLTVRSDGSPASTATSSGDYSGLITDEDGRLYTNDDLKLWSGVALASPFDRDTGAGTENLIGVSLRLGASGGSVEFGTATNPFRMDPTGTTTQPISAVSLPLPTGAATAANQLTAAAHDAAFGTAGTPDAQVRSVQGVSGGTPLDANLSQVAGAAPGATNPLPVRPSNGTAFISPALDASVDQLEGYLDQLEGYVDGLETNTTRAASTFRYISVGTTEDEHAVKATAGRLHSILATNVAATVAFLKCENDTAVNTAPGTDTPEFSLAIPGAATGGGFIAAPVDWPFSTAWTCWIVTGKADSDVTEVGANDVMVNYSYE